MLKFAVLSMALFLSSAIVAAPKESINDKEAAVYAEEAYILGYPLVMMETARKAMTASEEGTSLKPQMGQLAHMRQLARDDAQKQPFSNIDMLYSIAWIDLSKEPYLLNIPKIENRVFLFPMIGAWNEEFFAIGGTSGEGGLFLITGPEWEGEVPKGATQVKSPTNLVFIPGRIFTKGTSADVKLVNALQDQIELKPLSKASETIAAVSLDLLPPQGPSSSKDTVAKMSAQEYFQLLASLLKANPPAKEKNTYLGRFKKIGIEPGAAFDITQFKTKIVAEIEKAPKTASEKITARENESVAWDNTWTYTMSTGGFGTDYLQRAHMAQLALGANLPRESIYLITDQDQLRRKLSGKESYILHFTKERLPPVKGLWSITVYDEKGMLTSNMINRYSLSSKDPLRYNEDGSLDIVFQKKFPGQDKEANWIPVPEGAFVVMLRLYMPLKPVLENNWHPPAVSRSY